MMFGAYGPDRSYSKYIHKSIIQHHIGGAIIRNNVSLTCRKMINPTTGWFDIVEIQTLDFDENMTGNDEYTDKSYDRVSHLFKNTWICRCPCPRQVVFDKRI